MDGRKNNKRTQCFIYLLMVAGMAWLALLPLAPAYRAWFAAASILGALGWSMARRYRWIRWLSAGGSVLSLLLATMLAESTLSLTAVSMLYLFIWV